MSLGEDEKRKGGCRIDPDAIPKLTGVMYNEDYLLSNYLQ